MTDVLRLLQPLEWRGVRYPVSARTVSFQHDNADHKIQYRDGDFVEQMGAKSFTFSYTIPMREDIARGPYKNLFSVGLPVLLRDMRNRVADTLHDPVYGDFRCVPTSYQDETDIQKRDGTDLHVEFKHSPEFAGDEPKLADNLVGISGLIADAGQLEQQLTLADWHQEPSPEGVTDILSAINGIGRQALGQVDRFGASLADLAFKLEKIEDTADKAENPQNWQLRDDVRRVRDATLRLHDRASENPVKKILKITRRANSTVSSCAQDLDMTVAELLRLNPFLAKSPVVPAGTIITKTVAKI